jgi:hypothetical protein
MNSSRFRYIPTAFRKKPSAVRIRRVSNYFVRPENSAYLYSVKKKLNTLIYYIRHVNC